MERNETATDFDPKPYLEFYSYLRSARTKFKYYGASEDQILELAVIAYQRDHGLKATGKLDDETRSVMNANGIRYRCRNPDYGVNDLEPVDYVSVLERTGCFTFEDGGASVLRMLERAVKEYQEKFGIEVTGELDEETTSHMRTV